MSTNIIIEKILEDLEKEVKKLYKNALYIWNKSNAERDNKIYAMGQSDTLAKFLTERDGTIIKKLKEKYLKDKFNNKGDDKK